MAAAGTRFSQAGCLGEENERGGGVLVLLDGARQSAAGGFSTPFASQPCASLLYMKGKNLCCFPFILRDGRGGRKLSGSLNVAIIVFPTQTRLACPLSVPAREGAGGRACACLPAGLCFSREQRAGLSWAGAAEAGDGRRPMAEGRDGGWAGGGG